MSLQTLNLKKIENSKQYGPEDRTRFAAIFNDDRLYLFGGKCGN